jgi:aspartyl-tRNA(Asn)/glutamyl-tRNA(Gln) amidotransferase subunit B
MNWFTGQAMKASKGKANPKMVTEIVRKKVLG